MMETKIQRIFSKKINNLQTEDFRIREKLRFFE